MFGLILSLAILYGVGVVATVVVRGPAGNPWYWPIEVAVWAWRRAKQP